MLLTTCRAFVLGPVLVFNLGGPVTAAEDKLPTGAVLQFGRPQFQSPTFGGHAVFSPDGKLLATWAQNTDGIAVWDLAAKKIVRKHKVGGTVLDLRWKADGKLMALCWAGFSDFLMREWKNASDPGLDDTRLQELSTISLKKIDDNLNGAFFLDDDHVGSVFFKNVGPPPATAQYRLAIYKFAPNTLSRMAKPEGSVTIDQWEWGAGRSLDEKVLFFHNQKRLIAYEWLAITKGQGKPLWSFETGPGDRDRRPVRCVSPDGKQVVVSLLGGELELWDGPSGKLIRSYPMAEMYHHTGRGEGIGLAVSPDGKRLAVMTRTKTGESGGRITDLATGKEVVTFTPTPMPFLKGLQFSPDGKRLAQIGEGQLRLLDPQTGADLVPISGHRGDITSVIASLDGKTLVSCGSDLTVRGWDVASGQETWKTTAPRTVYLRFVTGDSVVIEDTSFDGVEKPLLDLKTGAARALPGDMGKKREGTGDVLRGSGHFDSLLAISPDGKTAATLDQNGPAIRIWNWPDGKLVKTWPVEIPKEFSLRGARGWYGPAGKEFLVALQCSSHTGLRAFYPILLDGFDTATGKRLAQRRADGMQTRLIRGDVGAIEVTESGEVRDAVDDKPIVKLHQTPVKPFIVWRTGGMAVSPDGGSLAVGGDRSGSGQIEVYDLKNGRVRKTIETGSRTRVELAFLQDGRLVSAGDKLLLWPKP